MQMRVSLSRRKRVRSSGEMFSGVDLFSWTPFAFREGVPRGSASICGGVDVAWEVLVRRVIGTKIGLAGAGRGDRKIVDRVRADRSVETGMSAISHHRRSRCGESPSTARDRRVVPPGLPRATCPGLGDVQRHRAGRPHESRSAGEWRRRCSAAANATPRQPITAAPISAGSIPITSEPIPILRSAIPRSTFTDVRKRGHCPSPPAPLPGGERGAMRGRFPGGERTPHHLSSFLGGGRGCRPEPCVVVEGPIPEHGARHVEQPVTEAP